MARWNIDPMHSEATFTVKHLMFSKVRGSFAGPQGYVDFDPDNPAASSVEATIDVSTISTGAADRDAHLRSEDFFMVEEHPTMTFKSTNIEVTGDNTGKITGDLTMRGVTKPVTFDVEFMGSGGSPFGDLRAGFTGSVTINRKDWGLSWNQALETGGVLVSEEVTIDVELQVATEAETA